MSTKTYQRAKHKARQHKLWQAKHLAAVTRGWSYWHGTLTMAKRYIAEVNKYYGNRGA